MSEGFDRLGGVEHTHDNSSSVRQIGNGSLGDLTSGLVDNLDRDAAGISNLHVGGSVLISEGVTTNDDGLIPVGNEAGNVLDDNRLTEYGSIKLVSDGTIGAFPHLFELKLRDASFVRSDGGALDSDLAILDGVSGVEGDLVIGGVSVLHGEIEVLDGDVDKGENEFVSNQVPDDAGHLVAIHFDDGVSDLDLLEFLMLREATSQTVEHL